jgi:hypothetical protein
MSGGRIYRSGIDQMGSLALRESSASPSRTKTHNFESASKMQFAAAITAEPGPSKKQVIFGL